MRISLTDRCNLRCVYCMPHGIIPAPRGEVLREDEIVEIASCAVPLGITRFKLTGGEPLVRRCCRNVAGRIRRLPGVESVTLTTNGILLRENLGILKEAGIDGINISLDTTDPDRYRALTGGGDVSIVLDAIEASVQSGIRTRVNTVLFRKMTSGNPDSLLLPDVLEIARRLPVDVRFIEMMPIGRGRDYPSGDHALLLGALRKRYPQMRPDPARHGNGPAVYYSIPGFLGDIGFISAIHGKFCSSCNRLRLTSMGYLKTCLAYEDGTDLRRIIREQGTGEEERRARISRAIEEAVRNKPKAHCFDQPEKITETHPMASIGG